MTEKEFEKLKTGDTAVYRGRSPLGEDFTRGKTYNVCYDGEDGVVGFWDDNGEPRLFRCAQAQDVFCSQEEWDKKWQYVCSKKDIHVCSKKDIHITDVKPLCVIDWEQRRYEIALSVSPYMLSEHKGRTSHAVMEAVGYAEALIDELKKSQTQG